MATAETWEILFVGPPDALEAVVPVAPVRRHSIRVVITGDWAGDEPRVLTAPAGTDRTLVRLVADPTAAAGRYAARVLSDDGEFPAVVAIDEERQLTVHPATLQFRGAPGAAASTAMVVRNVGNAPVALRRTYVVGLLENGAIESAIGRGLRMRTRAVGESRFEVVGDELADRYAGGARLRIEGLAGSIAPGETANATATLLIDRRARGNRGYHGLLELDGAKVRVHVTTTRSPKRPADDVHTEGDLR